MVPAMKTLMLYKKLYSFPSSIGQLLNRYDVIYIW